MTELTAGGRMMCDLIVPCPYLDISSGVSYLEFLADKRIDWEEFKKIGVTRSSLEKSKSLDDMLNYRKSPGLITISMTLGNTTVHTDARLGLNQIEGGRLVPDVYAIRKEPQLDRKFHGHTFTDEDKKSLRETGNMGYVVEIEGYNGHIHKAFISVDKFTNDLVSLRADRVRLPDQINVEQLGYYYTFGHQPINRLSAKYDAHLGLNCDVFRGCLSMQKYNVVNLRG